MHVDIDVASYLNQGGVFQVAGSEPPSISHTFRPCFFNTVWIINWSLHNLPPNSKHSFGMSGTRVFLPESMKREGRGRGKAANNDLINVKGTEFLVLNFFFQRKKRNGKNLKGKLVIYVVIRKKKSLRASCPQCIHLYKAGGTTGSRCESTFARMRGSKGWEAHSQVRLHWPDPEESHCNRWRQSCGFPFTSLLEIKHGLKLSWNCKTHFL